MPDHVSSEGRFDTTNGLTIFYRSWRPSGPPRAIVAICHGVNSHSGHYVWAGEQFAAQGYAAYALDLRGRGQSDGERFYVDSVEDYVEDLSRLIALAREREPGLPVFLLGHSAGGLVSCAYTLENQAGLKGFICESFAFQLPAPEFALAALKGLSHLAPHAHVLRLQNEDFSRDKDWVRFLNEDPLIAHETQPTKTVAALARFDDKLKTSFAQFKLPVLIMHGTKDKATLPGGSQKFYNEASSEDKTLKLYEGHYHDLLNDKGREEVLADILAWIGKRLA